MAEILVRRRVPLFCFPCAGGSARAYEPWRTSVPEPLEVRPVELAGRGHRIRERPLTRLTDVVDDLAGRVRTELAATPGEYVLFGHSLGAVLAYECARVLTTEGHRPAALVVAAHRAPHLPLRERRIQHLPDDRFLAGIRALARTPGEVFDSPEPLRVLMPALRADFAVSEGYEPLPGELLRCPVLAFGGTEDPTVALRELWAWRDHTTAGFAVRLVPGGHFFPVEHGFGFPELLVGKLVPMLAPDSVRRAG
ncbi:thioesterase [Amycolatopsis sp. A1MSW2902]|uniref:thioesterase II family protein n=1 Tax=Amycolatopsis sp. A1MSW2902 TaxID=687413 RepID=UPI00307E04A1